MKAITLTQPWASLVAMGHKKIETRSWKISYCGPLAIHAGKGAGRIGWMQMNHLCRHVEPFKSVLRLGRHPADVLPLGAIIAMCDVVGCVPADYMKAVKIIRLCDREWLWTEQEKAFGDYSSGRYAWLLADVRALPVPIPCKGKLGLWNYEGELPL